MFWIIAGLVFVAFFAAGCLCCGCVLVAPTTSSSDFIQEAGTWTFTSGMRTSNSNAILVYDTAITEADFSAQVGTTNVGVGQTVRIYARTDASNYVVGEWKRSAINSHCCGWLKLFSCTSGTETLLAHSSIDNSNLGFIRICIDDTNGVVVFGTSASTFGTLGKSLVARTSAYGQEVALGTATVTAEIGFGSFEVRRLSATCVTCGQCCLANTDYAPEEIQVEIIDLVSEVGGYDPPCLTCENLNGTYVLTFYGDNVTFDSDVILSTGAGCTWVAEIPSGECGADYIVLRTKPDVGDFIHEVFLVSGTYAGSTTYYIRFQSFGNDRVCDASPTLNDMTYASASIWEFCRTATPSPDNQKAVITVL